MSSTFTFCIQQMRPAKQCLWRSINVEAKKSIVYKTKLIKIKHSTKGKKETHCWVNYNECCTCCFLIVSWYRFWFQLWCLINFHAPLRFICGAYDLFLVFIFLYSIILHSVIKSMIEIGIIIFAKPLRYLT